MIDRSFPVILSTDLPRLRDFYCGLLGFTVAYDSDWFVSLQSDNAVELGIWRRDHELLPEAIQNAPQGVVVVFVVGDVDAVHGDAVTRGVEILRPPADQFYGQRSFLARDPEGTVLDISSPCDPSPEFLASFNE